MPTQSQLYNYWARCLSRMVAMQLQKLLDDTDLNPMQSSSWPYSGTENTMVTWWTSFPRRWSMKHNPNNLIQIDIRNIIRNWLDIRNCELLLSESMRISMLEFILERQILLMVHLTWEVLRQVLSTHHPRRVFP